MLVYRAAVVALLCSLHLPAGLVMQDMYVMHGTVHLGQTGCSSRDGGAGKCAEGQELHGRLCVPWLG